MNTQSEFDVAKACAAAMYAGDQASQALGIHIEIIRPGVAKARMRVRDDMVNGQAICHGGLIFTLADTAFAFACNSYNRVTVAASASIDFLRPARLGDELLAVAEEIHRGGRSGLYDVRVSGAAGEALAVFRGRSATTREQMLDVEPTPGP
jgi:phenylacetic acid degradation protein PaaD